MHKYSSWGPTLLRLVLGIFFLITGFSKLANPKGTAGFLSSLGFPAATVAWILLLSEIIFGIAVLIGWKVQYTVWPLVIVLLVATITVVAPTLGQPMGTVSFMFHILGIAALLSLTLTGPGAWAFDKKSKTNA